ncbi:hypothetical protein [Veillonella agrestimuris]|uniref:hypothetical protein n=1 Tax=Veillonella agrestimuris TaxID=2941340 RepID=UPI00203F9FEF|nr:hypothetical protein [Veillonella agrestimuris]
MNLFELLRDALDVNHEVEFVYNGFECFIAPTNLGWELWVNNERIYREEDLELFLKAPSLNKNSLYYIFSNGLVKVDSIIIF